MACGNPVAGDLDGEEKEMLFAFGQGHLGEVEMIRLKESNHIRGILVKGGL